MKNREASSPFNGPKTSVQKVVAHVQSKDFFPLMDKIVQICLHRREHGQNDRADCVVEGVKEWNEMGVISCHFFLANIATNPMAPITVAPPRATNPIPIIPPATQTLLIHNSLVFLWRGGGGGAVQCSAVRSAGEAHRFK